MNLLNLTDLLIDGQYVESKNDGMGLRGSNNQRFHYLTNKLDKFKSEIEQKRRNIEFKILDDGVLMTGIPQKDFKW